LKKIEGFNQLKESRKFYKLTNRLRKEYKPNILTCKKLNGELTTNETETLVRWKILVHFKELLDGTTVNLMENPVRERSTGKGDM
jgi:hypothetical protein